MQRLANASFVFCYVTRFLKLCYVLFFFFFHVFAIQIYKMCILSVQVQRLADYQRYLGQEARNLIDNECIDSGTVLHRGQLEGDLHRIQELFPGDNLRLHERDVVTTV